MARRTPGSFAHTVIVDAERAMRHVANKDILGDCQVGEKSRMLVHHGNSPPLRFKWRPMLDGDSLDEDVAHVRPVDSREQLHARALACAVLAQESNHLSAR